MHVSEYFMHFQTSIGHSSSQYRANLPSKDNPMPGRCPHHRAVPCSQLHTGAGAQARAAIGAAFPVFPALVHPGQQQAACTLLLSPAPLGPLFAAEADHHQCRCCCCCAAGALTSAPTALCCWLDQVHLNRALHACVSHKICAS